MAEERTLGLARASASETEEYSKEELQRRMEEARDSISNTVSEIKETVAHQVESVKEALDWREQFRKRPLAWSLGAMGVGFCAGYGIAASIKGGRDSDVTDYAKEVEYEESMPHAYSAQPILGEQTSQPSISARVGNGAGESGPGWIERFKETSAYDRLSKEVSSLGDRVIDELSSTAQQVVLPALLGKIKDWIGIDLSSSRASGASMQARNPQASREQEQPERGSGYRPVLERPV